MSYIQNYSENLTLNTLEFSPLRDALIKNLNDLEILNLKGERINLDNDLATILKFLNISLPEEYLNRVDHDLIKRQLFIEGAFLYHNSGLNESRRKLDKALVKKLLLILKENKLEFYSPLKDYINLVLNISLSYLIEAHYSEDAIKESVIVSKITRSLNYVLYQIIGTKDQNYENFKISNESKGFNNFTLGFFIVETFVEFKYLRHTVTMSDTQNSMEDLRYIIFTDKFDELSSAIEIRSSRNIPMIVEPVYYEDNMERSCGYLRSDLNYSKLTHSHFKYSHQTKFNSSHIKAIRKLSSTKLRINKSIIDFALLYKDIIKAFPIKSHMKLLSMAYVLSHLNIPFYLPCYFDWRGRIYTFNTFLSYQSNELSQSLISLFDGHKIDDHGYYALRINAANMYGHDKKSNTFKINWISENLKEIVNMDTNFILGADNIFQFYSNCLSISNYLDDCNYIEYSTIQSDATCSGIQHISGLMHDIVLGEKVNITPATKDDTPEDIYTDIIPYLKEELEKFILETSGENDNLRNLRIDRKFVKRPIMTIPYSVTERGIIDQILNMALNLSEINKKKKKYIKPEDFNQLLYEYNGYNGNVFLTYRQIVNLAGIIKRTVNKQYRTLETLYKYFQEIVKLLIVLKVPIVWKSPTGIIIRQSYNKLHKNKLIHNINYRKRRIVIYRKYEDGRLDMLKSKQAVSPNIIHTLDSSLLMLIIQDLSVDVLTVHDCFIIHPNNMKMLYEVLIHKFIKLYCDNDFLLSFRESTIYSIRDAGFEISSDNKYILVDSKTVIPIPEFPRNTLINPDKFRVNILKSEYMII